LKALNEEIVARKYRSKELHMTARRLSRQSSFSEDQAAVDELDELRQQTENLAKRSAERLSLLEQAVPLAEHFYHTRDALFVFFDQLDKEVPVELSPGSSLDQAKVQQETVQVSCKNLLV
jgi:dystonin